MGVFIVKATLQYKY